MRHLDNGHSLNRTYHRLPGNPSHRPVLIFLLGMLCAPWGARADVPMIPDFTAVPYTPIHLQPAATNPVLRGSDLPDSVQFVADPFLYRESDTWYLFFEAYSDRGHIGYATSADGIHYTFQHLLTLENVHLSYPFVFSYRGEHYLMPESGALGQVRLYKAQHFPDTWAYDTTLVSGAPLVDPTLIRYQDRWWLFVSHSGSVNCFLFYSDSLRSGWREHPMSPVVHNDRSRARAAGRSVVLADGVIVRMAQKNDETYGGAVRACRVDTLTTTRYHETELPESPILQASGQGWNADGMHQFGAWWDSDRWLVAADGDSASFWSIGIYQTAPLEPATAPGIVLGAAAPNPAHLTTSINFLIRDPAGTQTVQMELYNPMGRLVRRLVDGTFPPGAYRQTWDGKDGEGRACPSGIYLVRLRSPQGTASRSLVWLR